MNAGLAPMHTMNDRGRRLNGNRQGLCLRRISSKTSAPVGLPTCALLAKIRPANQGTSRVGTALWATIRRVNQGSASTSGQNQVGSHPNHRKDSYVLILYAFYLIHDRSLRGALQLDLMIAYYPRTKSCGHACVLLSWGKLSNEI